MTILIAARNASATIERAVSSALKERAARLVLIDDHSTDDTVARARAAAGSRLRVLRAPDPGGIAIARQAGLDAIDTEFAAWLDADDEWVPGRLERLTTPLRAGFDVAVESLELVDGPSGRVLRRLTVPGFLRQPGGPVRLFERNVLPGDTQVAFRVSEFREAGGYDPSTIGPESYDLLLRALRRGATFAFGEDVGYRMHAYPSSLSRDVARQEAAIARVLSKHDYADVRQLYRASGHGVRVTAWALVTIAVLRRDVTAALAFLDEASPASADPDELLEPDGPWPMCEGWRRAFQRGTILLIARHRDGEAEALLRDAEDLEPTPEGANNLGVALSRLGHPREAGVWFATARARFEDYFDARLNARARTPSRVTLLPLRRFAARQDYAADDHTPRTRNLELST